MEKRALGKTGVSLSQVGYGAASLFGKDVLGKQGVTEEGAYALFTAALERGVTFFDTGINYGYAEERLGRCIARAIRQGLARREDLAIESKCGETILPDGSCGPTDWSPDWLWKSLEISLKRLQLEYLDLYAMHGFCAPAQLEGVLGAFQQMKSQGLIRAYGVNTFDTDYLEWVAREKCFDYVMLDYNILRQDREPLIERLTDGGVAVLAGAALGESLYSKKLFRPRSRNDLWYLARALMNFKELMNRSRDFRFLTKQPGFTANQLALRYVLDNPRITAACFSTVNVEHLMENLRAVDLQMPRRIREEIMKRRTP